MVSDVLLNDPFCNNLILLFFFYFFFQTPPSEGADGHVRPSPKDLVVQAETNPDQDRRTDQRAGLDSNPTQEWIDQSN
jgi:hypothetical protein